MLEYAVGQGWTRWHIRWLFWRSFIIIWSRKNNDVSWLFYLSGFKLHELFTCKMGHVCLLKILQFCGCYLWPQKSATIEMFYIKFLTSHQKFLFVKNIPLYKMQFSVKNNECNDIFIMNVIIILKYISGGLCTFVSLVKRLKLNKKIQNIKGLHFYDIHKQITYRNC